MVCIRGKGRKKKNRKTGKVFSGEKITFVSSAQNRDTSKGKGVYQGGETTGWGREASILGGNVKIPKLIRKRAVLNEIGGKYGKRGRCDYRNEAGQQKKEDFVATERMGGGGGR